ncbi:MAG: GNAT family N-acetyltransferase [Puniceicoccaceae bacterium]
MILRERRPDPFEPADLALVGRPYREALASHLDCGDWVGRVLAFGTRPAGIALLDLRGVHALLLDWRVDPLFRKAGLGARLLARAEEEALARGKPGLRILLPDKDPAHRILDRRGWPPASNQAFLFRGKAAAGPPWAGSPRLRSLVAVPWSEATASERRILADPVFGGGRPPAPIRRQGWDPRASGLLRGRNGPAGWLLAEECTPGSLHVASARVHPSCERAGGLLCLVRRFLAAAREKGAGASVSWSVDGRNARFLAWIDRHWRPFLESTVVLEERILPFSPESSEPVTRSRR